MAGASMAGAALNAGSGITSTILSGIFGRNQQNRQHKYDLELAQMNYDYGREMLKRQQDYQTQMWNAENEYNSAKNQRARLEEAGLNPYLMLDGGNAGTASSVTSPSSSPGNASNSASPFKVDTSGIQQAGQVIADVVNYAQDYKGEKSQAEAATESAQAKAKIDKAQANVANAKAVAELDKLQKENSRAGISNEVERLKYNLLQDTYLDQKDEIKFRVNNLRAEYQGKILQNNIQERVYHTWNEKFNREMAFMDAQIFAAYKAGELSIAQAEYAYTQNSKALSEKYGIDFSNKLNDETFQYQVDKIRRESYTAGAVDSKYVSSLAFIYGQDALRYGFDKFKDWEKSFKHKSAAERFGDWEKTQQYRAMPLR